MRDTTLTLDELSERSGVPTSPLLGYLRDFERRGIAEETPDGWRLTESGFEKHGAPLLGLDPGRPLETPAIVGVSREPDRPLVLAPSLIPNTEAA